MPPLDYLNFDLLLEARTAGYRARVVASPAGEAQADFDLAPLTPVTDVQTTGAALFNAVFAGRVGDCLTRAWQTAQAEAKGLRLRLRIDEQATTLAALPWETLYWAQQARFLALSVHSPIVRYIEQPRADPPLAVAAPLRLLALIAAPADLTALDSEHEWHLLQTATADLVAQGQLVLERLAQPTLAGLQDRLRQGDVHLLHFMGHGQFDAQTRQGTLFFEDAAGNAHPVDATTLAILLHDQPPRLIFLNAGQGASSDGQNFFAGVAQALVQARIPAVIAMPAPIRDTAAITLAHTFYKALAAGYPADVALTEARKAIYAADPADALAEWATPILFSRAPDNQLFALGAADEQQSEGQPTVQVNTDGGTYIEGNATVGGDLIGRDKSVHGDEVHGDKVAGDKVAGNKITNIYVTSAASPAAPTAPLLAATIERQTFEPETVLIPAGAFVMGDDDVASAAPRRTLPLAVYRIGKYPVTHRQYAEFLKRNPAQPEPDKQHWFLRKPKKAWIDHPVVNMTWYDAVAYCDWLSQATGRHYALPNEAQWEKAARGPSTGSGAGQIYPWGDTWRDGYANVNSTATTPVETFAQAASPYGCLDLLGNVQEWTSSAWGEDDPPTAYVLRGGSFRSQANAVRCSARDSIHPASKVAWRGFRVVLIVE